MMELRLLGPLEASVPLPGGKPRALLARLALDAGRVVAADALVEALWGDRPPPSAPKVLQAHVSALRKALGADAIETRAPGYALRGLSSDLARFEQLVERARGEPDAPRRAELLRDALALWRGDPLEEFRREPFAQAAARRLQELRLDALARRIDADLELGLHERLVAELAELVAREPLREQPRRQLMLALYRSGRQADALAVYREGRRLLVDELGIDPSPALQELERAILRQDQSLDRTPPAEASLRGPIVYALRKPSNTVLLGLFEPLCADGRELLLVSFPTTARELAAHAAALEPLRSARVRTASFTTADPAVDLARFATEQQAELLVVAAADEGLIGAAPCDLALLANDAQFVGGAPVLVPFGGAREEWAALELAAWLARAHGLPLRLLGAEARGERRDASRTLAAASLALQRLAGANAEPVLIAPGADAILAQRGSVIVASLPSEGLDETRRALAERAESPVLLVHPGLRPSGLAPDRTLTRFSWSLAENA